MDKWKAVFKRIFYPPIGVVLVLIPITVVLLIFGLSAEFEKTPLAYTSYAVSTYTLVIVILSFPKAIKAISVQFWKIPIIKQLNENKFVKLFLNDIAFRGTVSIYQGFVINTLYAVFRGVTAFIYNSVWFAAIAVYYLFLGIVRLSLAHHVRKIIQYKNKIEREIFEWQGYRICGCLILLLNMGMSDMVILMIWDNQHFEYPGYIIYLSAAYTFYTAITATINIIKFRKLKSPVLSASKAIAFTGAIMSVMALQAAMIAQFGEENAVFRQAANTMTGSVVCISSVGIAIFMIVRATRKIKYLQINNIQTIQ